MADDDARVADRRRVLSDASCEETTAPKLAAGEKPKENAARLRAVLLEVARRYRERKGR